MHFLAAQLRFAAARTAQARLPPRRFSSDSGPKEPQDSYSYVVLKRGPVTAQVFLISTFLALLYIGKLWVSRELLHTVAAAGAQEISLRLTILDTDAPNRELVEVSQCDSAALIFNVTALKLARQRFLGMPPKPKPVPPPGSAFEKAWKGDVTALGSVADPDLRAIDAATGNTTLLWAAEGGNAQAVRLLLNIDPPLDRNAKCNISGGR